MTTASALGTDPTVHLGPTEELRHQVRLRPRPQVIGIQCWLLALVAMGLRGSCVSIRRIAPQGGFGNFALPPRLGAPGSAWTPAAAPA